MVGETVGRDGKKHLSLDYFCKISQNHNLKKW